MAGGQQTDLSPGSVIPSEEVALTGEGLSLSQGTIVADAEDGIELAGEGLDVTSGQVASAFLVGLRSRKVGSGSATKALTGASMSVAQGIAAPIISKTPIGIASAFAAGSFGKTRTKPLLGSASTFSAGTLTFNNQTDVTWVGVVPTVTFTQGTSGTYDLVQHTLNFNTAQHVFEVASGTLPTGITLNPVAGYVYNGVGANSSASVSINIADVSTALTGLDWNGQATGGERMLYWLNPPPIYGTASGGMTYMFKVYPRPQYTGRADGNLYSTTFFCGNKGRFDWVSNGVANTYYGAHPWPDPPSSGTPKWEISVRTNDFVTRDNGTSPAIAYNTWYNQSFVATKSGSNYNHIFSINLPNTTTQWRITTGFTDGSWAATNPPTPAIMFGQAPDFNGNSWGGYPGWEEANEIIRGIIIFDGTVSEAHRVALSAFETDSQVLGYCAANGLTASLWYLNMNPTPTDVTDKSGKGHHPSWQGTARPTLYTSTTPDSDFAARVAALGSNLILTNRFASAADIGPNQFDAVKGYFQGSGGNSIPIIDTAIKPSGTSSMRFDVVPQIAGSTNWWTNLSPDLSKRYGAGESVYFQFRYRVSSEIAADYAAKVFLFGNGDAPGLPNQSSCSDLEIELNSGIFGHKYLEAYNACPTYCGAGTIFGFGGAGNPGGQRFLAANTWMTIQCGVDIGSAGSHAGHDWFDNTRVRIWIQYETAGVPQPEILVFDWTGGVTAGSTPSSSPPCWGVCRSHDPGGGYEYGKLWLMPYNQELDSGAQPGKVWYGDLIVSKVKIAAVQA